MTNIAAVTAGAVGAYAPAVEALKAMGAIVCVEPNEFLAILQKLMSRLLFIHPVHFGLSISI